ncbi:hypothetical protein BH23CHL2_BH23CHL2_09570 [soil metagenome]
MTLRVLAVILALAIIGPACSAIRDDEPEVLVPTPTTTSEAAPTLPPLPIVTRTPVDPAQIPATPSGTAENIEIPSTYVVQEGDSLYSIAVRYQLDLAKIVALNGLSDPNDISVGQELILPVPEE